MKTIFLDTNFLLACFQFKVDIFDEIDRLVHEAYALYILEKTIEELKSVKEKQAGKSKAAAKFSLTLIASKKLAIYPVSQDVTNKSVDDILFELSEKEGIMIATQDQELKNRLKNRCPILTLRQKKHLIIY